MPPEIWEAFSFRQLLGFYKILVKQKTESMKWEAKLHGATDSKGKNIDLSNIQSEEEWKAKAAQVSGLFGFA